MKILDHSKKIKCNSHKFTKVYKEKFLVCRKELYILFILISAVKVLVIPTYRSTDFEVHRNWLAITNSLPITEWYTSSKSQWTLDYPPFFAWFEFCLGKIASFVDPAMLNIDNLNYESSSTLLFLRLTVIVTDLMFLFGIQLISCAFHRTYNQFITFGLFSLCNIGLLFVDHIHFQYNGILIGILLLSVAQVIKTRMNVLQGAVLFTILLYSKHIYLYVAPSFIVWLLKWYCLRSNDFFFRLIQLGIMVLVITIVSFGPFVSQLFQVFSRLFPFQRGLVHTYWAANIWSLYISLDKILVTIGKKLGWLSVSKTAAMTGGLVQESLLMVLPTPTPFITFIATCFSMLPILIMLLKKNQEHLKKEDFVRCLILCALGSFMFGWHVHEKAILTAIIPLGVLATTNETDGRIFIILSSTGCSAILPLLFPDSLIVFKVGMLIMYIMVVNLCLQKIFNSSLLYFYEWMYILLLPILNLYEALFHKILFGEKLPFLPLAMTSSYCCLGILYSWIFYYYANFFCDFCNKIKRN